MKTDRKEKICKVAIQLFNEKGYDKVSMREIAKESGTTIGNLTYHFKKKEDIVIKFVSDIHEYYSIYFSHDLHGLDLLKDVVSSFKRAKLNEEKYPFYFKDMNDLIKDSEYFKNMIYNFEKSLYDFYFSSFTVLQKDKILKQSFSSSDFHILAVTLTTLISGWLLECLPYNNDLIEKISISQNLAILLKPYLEDQYIADYQSMIKNLLSL